MLTLGWVVEPENSHVCPRMLGGIVCDCMALLFWRWAEEGLASPSRVALITLVSCSSAERGVGASVVAGSTSAVIAGLIQTSTINSVRAKVVAGVGLVPSPRIKGVSFDQGWHRIGVPRDWCKCKKMLSSNAFIVVVALIRDWMFTLKWGDSR